MNIEGEERRTNIEKKRERKPEHGTNVTTEVNDLQLQGQ